MWLSTQEQRQQQTCINGPNSRKTLVGWYHIHSPGWLRGTVVERWSLTGELSLSCARPAADG